MLFGISVGKVVQIYVSKNYEVAKMKIKKTQKNTKRTKEEMQ